MRKHLLTFLLTSLSVVSAMAQTIIQGFVTESQTKTPLVGVTVQVKGTGIGAITDAQGRFRLETKQLPPFVLAVSFVGFARQEVPVTTSNLSDINVSLVEQAFLADEVVIAASRVEETITKAAVTVERLGARQFQNSPAATPFDALQNLKGVDLLTQSLTFKSVNLRGFGANNNNRFVQLTDGMDNRSPGLGWFWECGRNFGSRHRDN